MKPVRQRVTGGAIFEIWQPSRSRNFLNLFVNFMMFALLLQSHSHIKTTVLIIRKMGNAVIQDKGEPKVKNCMAKNY